MFFTDRGNTGCSDDERGQDGDPNIPTSTSRILADSSATEVTALNSQLMG